MSAALNFNANSQYLECLSPTKTRMALGAARALAGCGLPLCPAYLTVWMFVHALKGGGYHAILSALPPPAELLLEAAKVSHLLSQSLKVFVR